MINACPDCGGPVVTPRAQYLIVACACGYVPRVLPDTSWHGRVCACASCLDGRGSGGFAAADRADALAFALASLNVAAERQLMLDEKERPCDQ